MPFGRKSHVTNIVRLVKLSSGPLVYLYPLCDNFDVLTFVLFWFQCWGKGCLYWGRYVRPQGEASPRDPGGLRDGCGQDYAERLGKEHVHQKTIQIDILASILFVFYYYTPLFDRNKSKVVYINMVLVFKVYPYSNTYIIDIVSSEDKMSVAPVGHGVIYVWMKNVM